jgi:hypothetical protein
LTEATKSMKPFEGRYQTATQVKGLSPVNFDSKEADSLHILEGGKKGFDMVRIHSLFRGLRPWYDIEWRFQELGRPAWFSCKGIFADNPKRRGRGNDRAGVGLIHSRGVAGVMPCERRTHSKGSAVLCRGKEKHGLYKETGDPCKQN